MISYVLVSLHSRLKSVEECLPHRPPSQCCFVELMPTSVGYFTNKYHGTWEATPTWGLLLWERHLLLYSYVNITSPMQYRLGGYCYGDYLTLDILGQIHVKYADICKETGTYEVTDVGYETQIIDDLWHNYPAKGL